MQQCWRPATLLKTDSNTGVFLPVSIPKVLGKIFFIEQLRWLLLNYVLVSERIFKKESNDVATTNKEVSYRLLPGSSFCCLNLITAAPQQLEIKRFVRWLWANDITTAWGGVSNGTLWIFLVILLTLTSSKLICILLTLGKSKFTLLGTFYSLWTGHSYFTEFE